MKKIIVFVLAAVLLCGCGAAEPAETETSAATAAPTTEPAAAPTEATEAATTAPATEPAPVFRNPLNGEVIEEPFTDRVFAVTISNIPSALPHVGVTKADILMEMYVNATIVRCLALYTDIESAEAIGSTRSTRLMFNDICQHYDLILAHAGGSSLCLSDAGRKNLTHYNVDSLMRYGDPLRQGTAYRDKEYKHGEHNLFTIGAGFKAFVESQSVNMTMEKDYGLNFTEEATPVSGEAADEITILFVYGEALKETKMIYDAALGQYVYNQYGMEMADQITGEVEGFDNVIVMHVPMTVVAASGTVYHQADFLAGGTGYFANGGKLIPIVWTCDGDSEPFRFFTQDGEPLNLGVGKTYIAVTSTQSAVNYTGAE